MAVGSRGRGRGVRDEMNKNVSAKGEGERERQKINHKKLKASQSLCKSLQFRIKWKKVNCATKWCKVMDGLSSS